MRIGFGNCVMNHRMMNRAERDYFRAILKNWLEKLWRQSGRPSSNSETRSNWTIRLSAESNGTSISPKPGCNDRRQNPAEKAGFIFERRFLVRKMSQLHGFHDAIHNHRGPKAGSQTEEQHLAAAFVTSERLHRGIIHNL